MTFFEPPWELVASLTVAAAAREAHFETLGSQATLRTRWRGLGRLRCIASVPRICYRGPMSEAPDERGPDAERKARGAFFTPPELAEFLANWAITDRNASVLEPSCGEAALLVAAGERLRMLGGATDLFKGGLKGVDVHSASIGAAREILSRRGIRADFEVGDFFDIEPTHSFDAVIGNPPYIRYQSFSGEHRIKAQRAALAQGVRLAGTANAWAAFVVHAAQFLNPTGRLALVLPAVLLTVNYAAPIRRFLLQRFKKVRLVLFEERVFPGVIEEVVLLLAEGTGPTPNFDLFQVKDLESLQTLNGLPAKSARGWTPSSSESKWTGALLQRIASTTYTSSVTSEAFTSLAEWGETTLGMVTGNNGFFTLAAESAQNLGLPGSELQPISPPGSRHLRGLTFSKRAFDELRGEGARVYLFCPDRDQQSAAAMRYIERGEAEGVCNAYKCAVRTPWWRVPQVPVGDLLLTYMNQDMPRLVTNEAGVAHLNSVHGVVLGKKNRRLGRELLPLAMLNTVTALGAELVGRSYGGGLLKLEPREADALPLPTPKVLKAIEGQLRQLRGQIGAQLRAQQLEEVVHAVDEILLVGQLGLKRNELRALDAAREELVGRRRSRSGSGVA